ncbi:MAG TPA: hypothetical protein VF803_00525 [Candidatus Paceibacterota bacterium]
MNLNIGRFSYTRQEVEGIHDALSKGDHDHIAAILHEKDAEGLSPDVYRNEVSALTSYCEKLSRR